MRILAILQARASSTRLPKKVLRPILGVPMLSHQINRTLKSKLIDKLVVATSNEESDNELTSLVTDLGIDVYRGSLNDVLDRFYNAAKLYSPCHIVRLTGDCPLIDSEVIDKVIQKHLDTKSDYTSNVAPPSFPDGLDVEVMTFDALELAWHSASLKSDREHVTSFMRKPESKLVNLNVKNDIDLSHLRWTVDEPSDFEFVTKVYENLYMPDRTFSIKDILSLLDLVPDLMSINMEHIRNEGYARSLLKDQN